MALYEVTIAGTGSSYFIQEEGCDPCYDEVAFSFIQEGEGLIDTMMSVQSKLDSLNRGLNKRFPKTFKEGGDWEFKVTGIWKTELIQFNDAWIKEYIEKSVEIEDEE